MHGPYVHSIDPVLAQIAGICLWWYGLSYALGFLQLHLAIRRRRRRLALNRRETYTLTLLIAVCVLAGGRGIEVAFDEWPFYSEHPRLIPALRLGGMATHGLLLGALAGIWIFESRPARHPQSGPLERPAQENGRPDQQDLRGTQSDAGAGPRSTSVERGLRLIADGNTVAPGPRRDR